MFTGIIKGAGPRYCPSIEDKVKRFAEKDRHQIFLEPEGLQTKEIYANGLSTGLPLDVQKAFLRTIPGLEAVEISRPGYAGTVDRIDPCQLKRTMEAKQIQGLFCAGQINGTSGYEEAGAQGIIAGINAAQRVREQEEFIVARSEGYIGVLIDDLVLKGADEPYRMFTSRAEYRLLLREDNADMRLSERGHRLGLLSEADYRAFDEKRRQIAEEQGVLAKTFYNPTPEVNERLAEIGTATIKDRISASQLLKRPEISYSKLEQLGYSASSTRPDVLEQVTIQQKYEGYIKRDLELLDAYSRNETMRIPSAFDYQRVGGLSTEVVEKLFKVKPETLGQALRVQGVTPAAVAAILVHLKSKHGSESHAHS